MKRKLFTGALLLAALAAPAVAILGFGDIVFDPTNYAEAIQEFLQLEQQYQQLILTYQTIKSQYDQMLWMAKNLPASTLLRYRAIATPWTPSTAANTYGTTASWQIAINTGQNVSGGYAAATEPLSAYGSALSNVPPDQLNRLQKDYGTVELADGASQSAIQTVGNLRANAAAVEMAIQSLENDSLSADPDLNTEIAVLNKINAAGLISLRNTQDMNKLLAAVAERQIVEAKRERDAEARAFNQHIQFMAQGQSILAAQAANASGAMLAWRMP